MARGLVPQIGTLLVASIAAGLVSNAARSSLDLRGGDPQLLGRKVDALSVGEAAKLQDDPAVLFLDVRPKRDFDAAHVRGAVSFSAADFGAAYGELRDFLVADVRLVVYGEETLPAVRAAEFLALRGLRPQVLEGGWRAWRARKLPVEGEAMP